MRGPRERRTEIAAVLALGLAGCAAAGAGGESNPLQRRWYEERGIELPRPFGVGVSVIGMERDIAVTDVTVTTAGLPPTSVSDRVSFDVENRTRLSMVRFDHWVLPPLNVYVLGGRTQTETSLSTRFELDPPMGPPIPVEVTTDSDVDGPLYGAGATLVGGVGDWFAMADANYSRSDLDLFDGVIDAWFLSARVGRQFPCRRTQARLWGGLAYLASRRTLTIQTDLPLLGPTTVEVEQEPVDPVTFQVGGSLSFERRWDLLIELGSNFDDAALGIVSLTYRW